MTILTVSSIDDGRLDVFARLTDHQLRRGYEQAQAVMIAESRLVIEVALRAGLQPVAFLMDERRLHAMEPLLQDVPEDVPVYLATRTVLSQIVGFGVTRGVMAALRRPKPPQPAELLPSARRIAVLEGLVDATNVGAIVRSAAALGVDAVLLDPTCADPYSRRAARVSMGASYTLPWARFDTDEWPRDALSQMRAAGFHIVALALERDATPIDNPKLAEHDRLALVFGTEGWGLAPKTIAACDQTAIIPMSHGIDSLNVAAASAVTFWQLCR